jgi:hypothetical protein
MNLAGEETWWSHTSKNNNHMTLTDLITTSTRMMEIILIPLAFALCILYFSWGVAKYIRAGAESEKAQEQAKNVIIWGIIGLFVAVSIWGLVRFIKSELEIPNITNIKIKN